ncbi:ADP-L-glycero-D-manno-heptose-6-epimerase [Candidatus Kaiserbacteria bacterium CG10_big_fil_rev_8_21_14_0_10_47_16]|uniref:ADP-L-glycero-D-manno-heptose-6-epimerase n=1 Tax=Candidatus Kaiserbacteria bacterium CG10_big_fil_rev_8_21_14_0_10_47_16 TaxID=1974608 RepID=A0A2H0UET6_9BACT|nr:MAG: ADP-L-glycero-D-manno-heptose-6-epimerase [Candidatus Kaiserbacteria bacterium CG10_big_fil_rev_8_21_14_0_10_47_16]
MHEGEKKTILVTGGAGFIGSHLCERLVQDGHTVISLDNYFTGSTDNHVAGVDYREGHTKDIEKHISETPDLVYHLGEYPRVEQSFDDIDVVLESNVVGTKAVLEFCRTRTCKLVYAGSSTKFADAGIGRDQSPYAWTKASNTEIVRNYGEWFNLSYAITYFYNVYGPRERGDTKSGTVIGIFAERTESNVPLQVRLPGTQKRNFTHVYDIVEGIVAVGERGEGDEYGIGHPDSYSILEVAEMFGGKIEMIPERAGNRQSSSIDVRRTELELGWKPKYSLPEYIETLKNG